MSADVMCQAPMCNGFAVGGSGYCEDHSTVTGDDATDRMVQRASIPNLAALTSKAVALGHITKVEGYAQA